MRDVARVSSRLRKSVRFFALTDVFLTLAFVLILALDAFTPGQVIDAERGSQESPVDSSAETQISQAKIASATTGKAIFRTSRVTKPKVLDELGSFQLKGIRKGSGEPRAYFRDTKRKQTLTKRVGEMLGTYEIVSIDSEGVTVRHGAEEVLLPKG